MASAQETSVTEDESTSQHWLIWDGTCTFCRAMVEKLRKLDRSKQFRISTYQKCPSPPMTPKLRAESENAVQVLTTSGEQISGGPAVLFALETVGWHPALMRIAKHPPFVWFVHVGYRIVANNRPFFSSMLARKRSLFGGR